MSEKRKVLIEIISFVVIFTFATGLCYNALRVKDIGNGGGIEAYDDIDVPVDVVVFGTSHAGCTVDNSILWDEYGIASYTLWSGSQRVDGTYLFMQDAFKKNKPKVALVETLDFVNDMQPDRTLAQSALPVDYSMNYVNWVFKTAADNGYSREYVEEALFKMPIIHSRYQELEKEDFIQERSYNRGYNGSNECLACEEPLLVDDREDLPETNMYYVDKIIDLCRENDVELIFFHAPYVLSEGSMYEQRRQNTLSDHFAERGIPFLDYYRDHESIGIDFATDLREGNHVNDLGAAKVTNALGQYLVSNYEFSDKSGVSGYQDWDIHSRYLEDRKIEFALKDAGTLSDYLDILGNYSDRFTLIVSFEGNYHAIESYVEKPAFDKLGLSEAYESGGIAVCRFGQVDFCTGDSTSFSMYREFENQVDFVTYKNEDDIAGTIILDGVDRSKSVNGFSIIVYDEKCNYVVDDVYVDVYTGVNILRQEADLEQF
nr:hypothetical protein [uncultured Butyrivibrio sp.]